MYQCDICHMQFSQKANMHRHRMRHSGVKPYQCRYCYKKFFRKDQVSPTVSRPYRYSIG